MPIKTKMSGFTVVELVVTLIIVGILAVTAIPRFFERETFDARSFSDQVLSILRYAQKSAIAQRRMVCVTFSAAGVAPATITLTIASTFGGSCDRGLRGPNGGEPYEVEAPGGVAFSALNPSVAVNSFSPLGRPGFGQAIQVGGTANIITIEPETGYVR